MVKKILVYSLLFILTSTMVLSAGSSTSKNNNFAAGIAIGESSYISLKVQNFLIGAGWSGWKEVLHAHVDYWFVNEPLGSEGLRWFLGLGAKIRLFGKGETLWDAPFAIGVRVPVGLQYYIKPQIELFGEIAPGLAIFPFGVWGDIALIGIRFYF